MKWRYGYLIPAIVVFITFYGCRTEVDSKEFNDNNKKFSTGKLNSEAPAETKLMGQLVGIWDAEQIIVAKDGSWPGKKTRAIWRWYYILDGQAVQDDWISIDSLNQQKAVGTNIRIYNPDEKQWYMAWIDKTHRRLATFTATNDSGNVIMDGINSNGRHIRNTFYKITADTFDWKQEWTFDEGKSWVEVARIHCTRRMD